MGTEPFVTSDLVATGARMNLGVTAGSPYRMGKPTTNANAIAPPPFPPHFCLLTPAKE